VRRTVCDAYPDHAADFQLSIFRIERVDISRLSNKAKGEEHDLDAVIGWPQQSRWGQSLPPPRDETVASVVVQQGAEAVIASRALQNM
jgi:hypothetical protein